MRKFMLLTGIFESVPFIAQQKSDTTLRQVDRQCSQRLVRHNHNLILTYCSDHAPEISNEANIPGCVTFRPHAAAHWATFSCNTVLPPLPSIANGVIESLPSHLSNDRNMFSRLMGNSGMNPPSSFAQFLTKLEGQAMTHFSIEGLPGWGDCLSNVHRRAMHCSVFPRPISSAMIHPYWFSMSIPVEHL
jgi:hypothetical protein